MRPARLLSTLAAATALASCMDMSAPTGPSRRSLVIVPRFSESASHSAATLAQAGLSYNSVRVVIVRPDTPPDTLKDTTLVFGPGSPEVTLELSVAAIPTEDLVAAVDFRQDGVVIYSGSAAVKAVSPTIAAKATPVEIEVRYRGSGWAKTAVSITPGGGLYSASSNTQFVAQALNASNAVITGTPIIWSVSD